MRKPQFTAIVWIMSVICLPVLVYIGSSLANITSLPFNAGCLPYNSTSGFSMSLMLGIPFATMVTVLSACNCLREGKGFNLWASGVAVLYLALAVFILYQTNSCV